MTCLRNSIQQQQMLVHLDFRRYTRWWLMPSQRTPRLARPHEEKNFIDVEGMFDLTHWETIVGRASRWNDIYILDVQPDGLCKYANTTIYRIYNKMESYAYAPVHHPKSTGHGRRAQHWDHENGGCEGSHSSLPQLHTKGGTHPRGGAKLA